MTKIELKSRLIQKIEYLEDEILMKEILDLIELENELAYEFSQEQKELIQKARKEVKLGEIYSNEHIRKEKNLWLKK